MKGGLFMNIKRKIVRCICDAQAASDAGKFGPSTKHHCREAEYMGYENKPMYIIMAIHYIDSNPRMGINYYVVEIPDQNGHRSVLVYFDIKEGGTRYQVSFHTPYGKASDLLPFIGKGRKTRWTKEIGGSRKACDELSRLYNL
jgi:hypothetical protein